MRTLKFRNNDEMPAFGLGTWNSKPGEVYKAVKTALKKGYRHIDCAHVYGNQKEIGQALTDSISEGIISREDLWITSKLWNNSHAPEDVIPALQETLKDLQLEYIDLYLIHWPLAIKREIMYPKSADHMVSLTEVPLASTWKKMEEGHQLGLAKHIGVSNFGIKTLEKLIPSCNVVPEMNQVECHPYLQQKDLFEYCQSKGIHFTGYCPLGSSNRPDHLKSANEARLLDDALINELAKSKNASPAQILISWALHRGASVIPKSTNDERISQNIEAEKVGLTDEEMASISQLDKNYRFISGETWVFEGGPYTVENIFG